MKKFLVCLMACFTLSFMFTSCEKDENVSFDQTLLVGKWKSITVKSVAYTTEYYKFLSNHSGTTWDTADDVTEAEGQALTWALDGDELALTHLQTVRKSMGRVFRRDIAKYYRVTELTATSLKFTDEVDGKTYSYTKVGK